MLIPIEAFYCSIAPIVSFLFQHLEVYLLWTLFVHSRRTTFIVAAPEFIRSPTEEEVEDDLANFSGQPFTKQEDLTHLAELPQRGLKNEWQEKELGPLPPKRGDHLSQSYSKGSGHAICRRSASKSPAKRLSAYISKLSPIFSSAER